MRTVTHMRLARCFIGRKRGSRSLVVCSAFSTSLLRMSAFWIRHNDLFKILICLCYQRHQYYSSPVASHTCTPVILRILPLFLFLFLHYPSSFFSKSLNCSSPFHKGLLPWFFSGLILFSTSRAAALQYGPSMFSYSHVFCMGMLRLMNS